MLIEYRVSSALKTPDAYGEDMAKATESNVESVLAAIAANEGPEEDGSHCCGNDTIVEATELTMPVVCAVLARLWEQGQIEGVLTTGPKPYLRGIRRVLPGRPSIWGVDGYYRPQP